MAIILDNIYKIWDQKKIVKRLLIDIKKTFN